MHVVSPEGLGGANGRDRVVLLKYLYDTKTYKPLVRETQAQDRIWFSTKMDSQVYYYFTYCIYLTSPVFFFIFIYLILI